jgi:hypothetical protein
VRHAPKLRRVDSDEHILARAEQICRAGKNFMKRDEWKAGMAAAMA